MSFLRRKYRHRDAPPTSDGTNLSALPEDDTTSIQTPSILQTPSIRSTNLRKRLSNFSLLASSLKRGRSHSSQVQSGLGYISSYRTDSRSRSPSPEPSLEIRRPSGLGRRASVVDLLLEQPEEGTNVYHHSRRKHSISTPELTLRPDGLLQWSHLPEPESPGLRKDEPMTPVTPMTPITPIPPAFSRISPELLKTTFAYATSADLASVALVCKALAGPARELLYAHIDLVRVVDRSRVEKCISLLASRRDLAGYVCHFACDTIPTASVMGSRTAFSVVTFAIALNNMNTLSSLTLPHFDATLLYHTTFRLQALMFLCERMSNDELQDTLGWLQSQPELTSLSFPNLILDDRNIQLIASSGSQQHAAESHETSASHSPLVPSDLLPKLEDIRGPSALLEVLVPNRPVSSVRLHIHSTIFDGLKPSSLISSIARTKSQVTKLGVITSLQHKVDARTIERVLMSAGSEFGPYVQMLEIVSTLDDEILRKVVGAVLPRFKTLYTLRLQRRVFPLPSTPPPTPSPFRLSPSSLLPDSLSAELPVPIPRSPMLPPRMLERTSLTAWCKHCSTLRCVIFPTAAEWSISSTPGADVDRPPMPSFTFLGMRGMEA